MSLLTKTPRVSVIIATYHSPATLQYSIASALTQTIDDLEVWVVGDGCTDHTADVVAAFDDPRLCWHNLPENSGNQSEPNNYGIEHARGEWIAYLGHDDLWFPWHLENLLLAAASQAADVGFDMMLTISPRGPRQMLAAPQAYAFRNLVPSRVLHRRSLALQVGGWRPTLASFMPVDTDFFSRIEKQNPTYAFVPRLGVVKYPSPDWRLYDFQGEHPQQKMWAEIQKNPAAAACELLEVYAAWQAGQPLQHEQAFGRQLRYLLLGLAERFMRWYGRERWPLRPILYRQHVQRVRRKRAQRGLPE